jgi:hypothetical protein
MCLPASRRVGARVDGTEKVTELLINVVRTNKPKTLIGLSQKARGGNRCFPFHLSQTQQPPADKQLLTIISIGLDTPDDESRINVGGSPKDVAGMTVSTSCLT